MKFNQVLLGFVCLNFLKLTMLINLPCVLTECSCNCVSFGTFQQKLRLA